MYRKSLLLIAALVAGATAVSVSKLDAADEPTEVANMPLVRQLGAASFGQRRAAAKALIELGMAAKPALMQGLEQEDLEIRLEAHRILVVMLQAEFTASIDTFLNNRSADSGANVPGWEPFKEGMGDSDNSRQLFADMLRTENKLIVALDQTDPSLNQLLSERIESFANRQMVFNGGAPSISGPTLATILFLGLHLQQVPQTNTQSNTNVAPITPVNSRIYSLLSFPGTRQAVQQAAYSPQIKQLLANWIDGISNSQQPYGSRYAIKLVLAYDLREKGPPIARKILEGPDDNFSSVPDAAIVLGRFGTPDDAKYLEPHLGSTQVFHTWSNPQLKKEPIRIQVRDAVLAMTIRLHGENPEAYGFNLLQPDEQTVYKVYSFGFLEDSERDTAFANWKARTKVIEAEQAAAKTNEAARPGEGERVAPQKDAAG